MTSYTCELAPVQQCEKKTETRIERQKWAKPKKDSQELFSQLEVTTTNRIRKFYIADIPNFGLHNVSKISVN